MVSPRHERISEVFLAVCELPAEERGKALDELCADDPSLRREVEALLARDAEDDSAFLQSPALGEGFSVQRSAAGVEPERSLVGNRISHYHLRRMIASGGMGTVYEAQQDEPRRTLAVKVMKRGITSQSALKRFEYESQILAHLRHPGIAHVYEAGRYEEGGDVPYFAMEFIADAKPITDYAKGRKLDTRQRLDLFTKVCDAVHHGHQKGVIHRDLKPSNILVDAEGEPKIIDFGVARATDSDIAITTLQTDVGQLIGTLQYMSPEQCEGHAHDLDTRSDVYSLGVVLYELLCDQVPYDVSSGTVPQAIQVIREETPARPSTINRTLRGDLETITLKALEKERQRRYDSAAALADDLRRYLNDEPIVARPASAIYQFRKFARRNKGLVAGMAIAALALIAGTAVAVTYAVREASAREAEAHLREIAEAESLTHATVNEIFADLVSAMNPDPRQALGREATVVEVLEQWESRLETDFANEPLVEAAMRDVIGTTYHDLGLYNQAESHLRREVQLRKVHQGKEHTETLDATLNLARTMRLNGKAEEAEPLVRQVYETRLRILGEDDDATLASSMSLVDTLLKTGQHDEAERLARSALETNSKLHGEDHHDTLAIMGSLANVLSRLGREDEAQSLYREVLQRNRAQGNERPETLTSMNNLAWHLLRHGETSAEPEQLFSEALQTGAEIYDENHPSMLFYRDGLIHALIVQGKDDDAEGDLRELLDAWRRRLGPNHQHVARTMHHLAEILWRNGKAAEAESLGRESLVWYRDSSGAHTEEHFHAAQVLAKMLADQGNSDEAETLMIEALDRCRVAFREHHPKILTAMGRLGHLYWTLGRFQEAEALYAALVQVQRQTLGPEHLSTLTSMFNVAAQYVGQGRDDEGEQLHLEVLEKRRRTLGEEHLHTRYSLHALGRLHERQGRFEEAAELFRETLEISRRVHGEDHSNTLRRMNILAILYKKQGRIDDARPLVRAQQEIERRRADRPEASATDKNTCAWNLLTCEPADLRDPQLALELAIQANDLTDHKNPGYLDTLSLAYHLTGDTARAIENQRQAIALLPPGDSPLRQELEAALARFEAALEDESE